MKIHSQILLTHNALVYFHKHVSFSWSIQRGRRRRSARETNIKKLLWCKFITKKFKFSRIKHDFLCNCDGAWRASEVKHLVALKIQNTNLFTNSPVSNSGRQHWELTLTFILHFGLKNMAKIHLPSTLLLCEWSGWKEENEEMRRKNLLSMHACVNDDDGLCLKWKLIFWIKWVRFLFYDFHMCFWCFENLCTHAATSQASQPAGVNEIIC